MKPPPGRPRFQLSLLSLLITITVASVSFATYRWLKSEAEVRIHFEKRGQFRFAHSATGSFLEGHFGTDPLSKPLGLKLELPHAKDLSLLSRLHTLKELELRLSAGGVTQDVDLGVLVSTNIKDLKISHGPMDQRDCVALKEMPNLRILRLYHVDMNDENTNEICGIKSLKYLEVYDCGERTEHGRVKLGDMAFQQIGELQRLTHLRLDGLGITDATVDNFEKLDQLEFLNLHSCHNLTNDSSRVIRQLQNYGNFGYPVELSTTCSLIQ